MAWNPNIHPRHRSAPGEMNKTEKAYAERLDLLQRAGEIASFRFGSVKLKLADKTWYTPDFYVVYPDHIEFHEVKGFWEDHARVKIKVVAEMYPEYLFVAMRRVKGEWEREAFKE